MPSATTLTSYKSHLFQMTQTTPTCLWNDSSDLEELAYSIEHGAVGATCNPVDCPFDPEKAHAALARPHRGGDSRDAHGHRRPDRLEDRRRDVDGGGRAAEADLRRAEGPQRPPFHPDGSALLPERRSDRRAGRPLQPTGAEHDRQDSGHARRHCGHRGSNVSRRQHQRHGVLHPSAGHRGGRGRGTRPRCGAKRKAWRSARWVRSAPSWSAAWTTG